MFLDTMIVRVTVDDELDDAELEQMMEKAEHILDRLEQAVLSTTGEGGQFYIPGLVFAVERS
jgi:hypothetical protein